MISANDDRLQRILLGQERLMNEVHAILDEEQRKDDILSAVVLSSRSSGTNRIARLDPERVFHISSIQRLCVRYRLRFLDSGLYKGKLPPRALYELRRLESRSDAMLRGFKVMAPAERFRLCDSNADPLLFVPVGEEHFYLVHKWGRDLHWSRAVLSWPKRGPVELAVLVLAMAITLVAVLPNSVLGLAPDAAWPSMARLVAAFYTTMLLLGITAFGWFAFLGTFSRAVWNLRSMD